MEYKTVRYKRNFVFETFRLLFRAIDLLILFRFISKEKGGLKKFKNITLIELGPGPTKLKILKSKLFKKVYYVDHNEYGDIDNVILSDLSKHIPTPNEILGNHSADEILYFADHCIEHLPIEVFENFLKNYSGSFVFRVPNIKSTLGRRDFNSDETHMTQYSEKQLCKLFQTRKFKLKFWKRFYSKPFLEIGLPKEQKREICLYD